MDAIESEQGAIGVRDYKPTRHMFAYTLYAYFYFCTLRPRPFAAVWAKSRAKRDFCTHNLKTCKMGYYRPCPRLGDLCFQPKTFRPKNFILAHCAKSITFHPSSPRPICLDGTFPPHFNASPPVLFYLVSALICHNPQVRRCCSFICHP